MIEIEKKFSLTDEQKTRLMDGAEFIAEKTIHDIYYDTPDFGLTLHGRWLRERDGVWELKLSLHSEDRTDRGGTQFRELETEKEIREELLLPAQGSFAEDLARVGYGVVVDIVTTRRKMKKEGFMIDFDLTNFGYEIAEIELLVEDPGEADDAQEKIVAFATRQGLSTGYVRGKILEYLRCYKPEHFDALVKAGIV